MASIGISKVLDLSSILSRPAKKAINLKKMRITSIQGQNFKSFELVNKVDFWDNINIFVGKNNSWKSTILNCILKIQYPDKILIPKRIGASNMSVRLGVSGVPWDIVFIDLFHPRWFRGINSNNSPVMGIQFSSQEPENPIFYYWSKRKVNNYSEQINEYNTKNVTGDFEFLFSRIDNIMNPSHPNHWDYKNACEEIIGFPIFSKAKWEGKRAWFMVNWNETIFLSEMWEGIPNLVWLIVDICRAEDKIFIIEEPENDIHPQALKKLMELITKKSINNQFFISTHSNIVLKYLGTLPETKIFWVTNELQDTAVGKLFTSELKELSKEQRGEALEDLGYDLFDSDLWSGWLFLEESSAEKIIRDFIIPLFHQDLKWRLRTFSCGWIDKVKNKFDDFNKLFVYLHLSETYKNKAWVMIDSWESERVIIQKMKDNYRPSWWRENNFLQFSNHDFEEYYPWIFSSDVSIVLAITDKTEKMEQKRILLERVVTWLKENPVEWKNALEESASEVIQKIWEIKQALLSQ